jgi:hypothetical protein
MLINIVDVVDGALVNAIAATWRGPTFASRPADRAANWVRQAAGLWRIAGSFGV